MVYNIVVLASGSGSNFEAIVRQTRLYFTDITVSMLITDKKNAFAIKRAEYLGIPYTLLPKHHRFRVLDEIIDAVKPHLIVLAGFMRIIPRWFVEKHFGKIVNIHPSLLPSFPGMHAIRQAYDYGVRVTGITIHFVDSGVDTGPIIFQYPLMVNPEWDIEKLEEYIHRLEHRFYTPVINGLLHCPYEIRGRKVIFTDNRGDACDIFRVERGEYIP